MGSISLCALDSVLLRLKGEYRRLSDSKDDMPSSFPGESTPSSPISGNTPPASFFVSDNPFQNGDGPLPF